MSQRVIRHADAAPPPKLSTLPAKEAALFKQIVRCYELKQYKKAIKNADAVLKKVADHGETLAMKALVLSQMPAYQNDKEKKDEVMTMAKLGLKNDLKSNVCWHVLGLIHRQEKQYDEASKAYLNALRFDKDNQQIIRDLTNLQVQRRDYEGFNETQHRLLDLKPAVRMHWLGLAVSYHLLNQHSQAIKILDTWFKTNTQSRTGTLTHDNKMEDQELWLYRCFVLEESGDLEGAVKDLEQFESEGKILDFVAYNEARVRIYKALGKQDKVEEAVKKLLSINPDEASLYVALEGDSPTADALLTHYHDLETKYPRSNYVRQRISELLPADSAEWKERTAADLQKGFRKGVPSLFTSIERMWLSTSRDGAAKKDWIRDTVVSYVASLEAKGTFGTSEDGTEKEPPTALPWARLFLSLLHDSDGNSTEALASIDAAISHTPTLVELHMTRGRVLKRAGRIGEAADALNDARELDLQDRFVNTKCAKYLLRAGRYEEAEKVVVLFTKAESTDPVGDLVEQQVQWWAVEAAEMWARKGEWGKAMKRWYQIEKHFADFYEDQFDYHAYCLRRMTMRSYIQMLRFEDRLRSHPFFFRAAVGATKAFIYLHDNPDAVKSAAEKLEKEMEGLSIADKKKAAKKAAAAAEKEKEKEKAAAAAAAKKPVDKDAPPPKKDDDPDGSKILEAAKADYLAEATKLFLKPLLEQSPGRVESQILGAEVYLRRRKYLLAVRSLLAGLRIAPDHPDLHRLAIRLHKEIEANPSENAAVKEVVEEGIKRVFPEFPKTDLKKWNEDWGKRNQGVAAAVSVAESSAILDPSTAKHAGEQAVAAVKAASPPASLDELVEAHKALTKVDTGAAAELAKHGASRWPLADYFKVDA